MVPRAVPRPAARPRARRLRLGAAERDPPPAAPAASPPLDRAPDGRLVAAPAPRAPPQAAIVTTAERGATRAVLARASACSSCSTARPASGRPADAGVGPTHVVSDGGGYLFVTDTAGGALLVFHLRPSSS